MKNLKTILTFLVLSHSEGFRISYPEFSASRIWSYLRDFELFKKEPDAEFLNFFKPMVIKKNGEKYFKRHFEPLDMADVGLMTL